MTTKEERELNKSSVLYVGTRYKEKLFDTISEQTELKISSIDHITELRNKLLTESTDTIIIEYTEDIDDVLLLLSFIQRNTLAPGIFITPIEHIKTGVIAMRSGAYNFLVEPVYPSELVEAIYEALRMRLLWKQVHEIKPTRLTSMGRMIGSAPLMQVLYKTIQNVSRTDATVFIQGASGTGKDLVAQAIHENSPRIDKEYVPINCAAIPPNLLESELFGHERGAFTGAVKTRIGKFEQADGGTLFLDEITEMPLDLQVKLLRVLQDQKVIRVGGKDVIPVNVRIICASNRNVFDSVKQGKFREDLYYRLNVVPVKTPSLCERREDIPLLLTHFLGVFVEKYDKYFYEFSTNAMLYLSSYSWPGNVREMENMIERIVVLNDGATVEEWFLPDEVLKSPVLPEAVHGYNQKDKKDKPLLEVTRAKPMWQVERDMIAIALAETGGDIVKASKVLEIGQATLYRKVKKYGIDKW
jgi:DNA-binding NtrC family response regulator